MPLTTTVVGAYPKPDYLDTPDWFRLKDRYVANLSYNSQDFTRHLKEKGADEALVMKAIQDVINQQKEAGIDIVSDGEVRRENYVHYFCRKIKGFDFDNSIDKSSRNGATIMNVPVVRSRLEPLLESAWCADEWKKSQAVSDIPVKYTLPGPMTITDSTENAFYESNKQQLCDLRNIVNREVRALAAAGCKYIQIDEPLLVRKSDIALDYGLDILESCFEGVGPDVQRIIHLCCGYPNYLDEKDYAKADKMCYIKIADKLNGCKFDAISLEDAHRRNDLELFDKLKNIKIILGSITVAESKVETEEEIRSRLQQVLQHVPPERLIVAPDCGLGYLPVDILKQKIKNMVAAAKSLP